MDCLRNLVKNGKMNPYIKWGIIVCILLLIPVLFVCICHEIYYKQLFIQMVLLALIINWIYAVPEFIKRIDELAGAFDNEEYKNEVNQLIEKMFLLDLINRGNCTEKRKKIVCKESSKRAIYRVFYCVCWLIEMSLYIFTYYKLIIVSSGLIGGYTLVLLFISLLLQCVSYYFCIVLTSFYWHVSNYSTNTIQNLNFNKYLPSSSLSFKAFTSSGNYGSSIFLSVTLIYSTLYVVNVLLCIKNSPELISASAPLLWITTFSWLLFGIVTALVVYAAPRTFYIKILNEWKKQSLTEFEIELRIAEQNNRKAEIDRLVIMIDRTAHDNVKSQPINSVVAITTIIINIVNIVATLYALEVL